MVSIHRPLGYGPSTLPLRHSAYLLCFSPAIVLVQAGLQERPLFRSHPRASESWKMVYWKLLVPIASAKSPVRILRNFIRSRCPVFFFLILPSILLFSYVALHLLPLSAARRVPAVEARRLLLLTRCTILPSKTTTPWTTHAGRGDRSESIGLLDYKTTSCMVLLLYVGS